MNTSSTKTSSLVTNHTTPGFFKKDPDAPFDELDFIMRYEAGHLESEEEFIHGFQQLVNSGRVWQLQGHYGRVAHELLEAGVVHPRPN